MQRTRRCCLLTYLYAVLLATTSPNTRAKTPTARVHLACWKGARGARWLDHQLRSVVILGWRLGVVLGKPVTYYGSTEACI